MNRFAASFDAGRNLFGIHFGEFLKRSVGSDDHWFFVSPAKIDDLIHLIDQPLGNFFHSKVIDYQHPLFDTRAIAAQGALASIQGNRRTWFCGAWGGYGFHEDGLKSALRVVNGMGIRAPWQGETPAVLHETETA